MESLENRWPVAVSLLGLAVLGGCDSTAAIQFDEAVAGVRCLQLAAERLGVPNGENGPEFEQVQADQAMAFHFVSTGQFVANFKPLRWKGADHPVKITCTGDYNRRTILSLQIDGTIQRPVKPEDWTF